MKKHDALVLGAYGCGVFGNDPHDVAEYFAGHLLAGGLFYNTFARVVFAVFDKSSSKSNFNAFKTRFQNA
ncbi:TIGR02452 family protein [Syntrophomonas wolfei]|uniref:TIGR02452 family protein n=1 Tax=Syntrophomonas wolfei TaxID=863 RepID=UPI0007743AC5|nr:TIGR02452 family protein [Syntrophomonas wolfei]